MNEKLRIWKQHPTWEEAERAWDAGAGKAAAAHPLKMLKSLPDMPGITKQTARFLRLKSLLYMVRHDAGGKIRKHFLKRPFYYGKNLLRSFFRKKSYTRDGDFFLYGVKSEREFCQLLQDDDALLVVGFSYCHKPFECPSGRFTKECVHDADNPVCRQCFIGKAIHTLPETNTHALSIITIHHIGEEMFKLRQAHPRKRLLFIITACELTLEMGGDLGNMIDAQGIGVRLDGRICNTMRAFELSEQGVKPGLTVVVGDTQKRLLALLQTWGDAQRAREAR